MQVTLFAAGAHLVVHVHDDLWPRASAQNGLRATDIVATIFVQILC